MEFNLNDMIIGCQNEIEFYYLRDKNFRPAATFEVMITKNKDAFVIIYQWIDVIGKRYNDREEAFYIDGVNSKNFELAKKIVLEVYAALNDEYAKNSNIRFDMQSYVESVVEKYKSKHI